MKKYAVIGTGNMGGALARALRKKLPGENVILFNRTAEKAQRLADELGCVCAPSAAEAARRLRQKRRFVSFTKFCTP